MNKIVEISTFVMELTATIQEGMEHLSSKMDEGHFEDTYYLFQDMVEALSSIYQAIKPFTLVSPFRESQIANMTETLIASFDDMNGCYEMKEKDKAQQNLTQVLFPAFNRWKGELEKCLHPLVDS